MRQRALRAGCLLRVGLRGALLIVRAPGHHRNLRAGSERQSVDLRVAFDVATDDTDAAVDRLFAVRPADFVKERNAVVKALKGAGRREEAARAEKLPRPAPSVWAVNQLARHVPGLVRRLAEATARLQAGGAGPYADALGAHRDVLKELRAKAEEILDASDLRPTMDVLTRVVHDLRAGMLNPEIRPLIEAGRLERDVAAEGARNPFEQELPPRPPAAPRGPEAAPDAEAARREARRLQEEAGLVRLRRLKQLREDIASAEATRDRGEKAVEAARRALDDAERRLSDSTSALETARAALERLQSEGESPER